MPRVVVPADPLEMSSTRARSAPALVAALLLLVVGAVACRDNGRASPAPSSSSTSSTIAPVETTEPPPLFELSGTGSVSTDKFAVPDTWTLAWSFDCSATPAMTGVFQITVFDALNAGVPDTTFPPLTQHGPMGAGTQRYHGPAGAAYLRVGSSSCTWSITARGAH